MNIAVNTRLLLKDRLEGIGRFTYESLNRITGAHPEHTFHFVFDREFDPDFIFSDNVKPHVLPPPTRHPFLWYYWLEHQIPKIIKQTKSELFVSPDGFMSLSAEIKSHITIHDINFLHRPGDVPFLASRFYNHFFPKYAVKSARIATVSEFSKTDIAANFSVAPNKIDVVYNGAGKAFSKGTPNEILDTREAYCDGLAYFLYVGALHPRKNIENLLLAFEGFKKTSGSDMKLIIAGNPMFMNQKMKKVYSHMHYKNDVLFTGWVSSAELVKLYKAAFALVFVPLFEGFGIPVIEAMYCDVPVITSNISSLPEVVGKAAVLTDPYSSMQIKDAMLKLVNNQEFRNNLIKNGRTQRQLFTWDKTAEKWWGSIEACFKV